MRFVPLAPKGRTQQAVDAGMYSEKICAASQRWMPRDDVRNAGGSRQLPESDLAIDPAVLNDRFFRGGLSMGNPKIAIVAHCLAATLLLSTLAHAATMDDKKCILASAEKLPVIPGLTIASSRAKQMPSEMESEWKPQHDRYLNFVTARQPKSKPDVNAIVIELDIKASGIDASFSFVCFSAPGMPPSLHSVGLIQ
jgi:hypothetical protein